MPRRSREPLPETVTRMARKVDMELFQRVKATRGSNSRISATVHESTEVCVGMLRPQRQLPVASRKFLPAPPTSHALDQPDISLFVASANPIVEKRDFFAEIG